MSIDPNKFYVCKLKEYDVELPKKAHSSDAGYDFYVPKNWNEGKEFILDSHQSVIIPSGIKVFIPEGYMLMGANKSGVATKQHIVFDAHIVDESYENQVFMAVRNTSTDIQVINPGQKLLQFILVPIGHFEPMTITEEEYTSHCGSARGQGGFGSTGL